jgi:hypothetical protein
MKSTRLWVLAAVVVVVLAAVGVLAWRILPGKTQHPAAGPGITGAAVNDVLLGGDELTSMLGQTFTATTAAPISGDRDTMEDPSTPGDCVGVVNVAPRRVYADADVRGYARQTWGDATPGATGSHQPAAKVMFVVESVVALSSEADAKALFAKFAEQWKRCDGRAVNEGQDSDVDNEPHLPGTEIHISDVRVTDTMLAASIALDTRPNAPDTRAIGVQGNCIVGVLIAFTGLQDGIGSGDPRTSSTDAVQAMMDKVAKLG